MPQLRALWPLRSLFAASSPWIADAVRAWRSALELDVGIPALVCNVGRAELRLNRYRDAAESLTRCLAGLCEAPMCSDGVQNGGESGIDCGGPCAVCP